MNDRVPPCPTVSPDTLRRPCPVSRPIGRDTDTVTEQHPTTPRPCPDPHTHPGRRRLVGSGSSMCWDAARDVAAPRACDQGVPSGALTCDNGGWSGYGIRQSLAHEPDVKHLPTFAQLVPVLDADRDHQEQLPVRVTEVLWRLDSDGAKDVGYVEAVAHGAHGAVEVGRQGVHALIVAGRHV